MSHFRAKGPCGGPSLPQKPGAALTRRWVGKPCTARMGHGPHGCSTGETGQEETTLRP